MSKMWLIISNWRQPLLALVLLLLSGYVSPQAVTAQDYVWTGAGSAGANNWNDPANWLYDISLPPVSDEMSMSFGWFSTTNTIISGSPLGQMQQLYFAGNGNYTLNLGSGLTLLRAGWRDGGSIISEGGTHAITSIGAIGYSEGTIIVKAGSVTFQQHLTNAVPTSPSFDYYTAERAVVRVLNGSDGKIWIDGFTPPSAGTVIYGGTSYCPVVKLVSGTLIVNGVMHLVPAVFPASNLNIDDGGLGGGGILAGNGTFNNIGRLTIPALATLRPGDPNENSGIGTLTFTNASSYLEFKPGSALEIHLSNRTTSSVVWPAMLMLPSSGAKLALKQIVGTRLADGTYTLLTYNHRHTNDTFDITFNEGALPPGLSVEYGPNALVLKVGRTPARATIIQIL